MANVDPWFRDSTADEENRKFDKYVHAVSSMDHVHRLAHDGFAFHVSERITDLANGASAEYLLKIPAGTFPHLNKFVLHVEGAPIDVGLWEGTTVSADGTLLSSYNRNRNSSNTASMGIYRSPTITGDGTQIHDMYVPTSGKDAGTNAPGFGEEWILAPSTNYLIRITNNSGGLDDISIEWMWYEPGYPG